MGLSAACMSVQRWRQGGLHEGPPLDLVSSRFSATSVSWRIVWQGAPPLPQMLRAPIGAKHAAGGNPCKVLGRGRGVSGSHWRCSCFALASVALTPSVLPSPNHPVMSCLPTYEPDNEPLSSLLLPMLTAPIANGPMQRPTPDALQPSSPSKIAISSRAKTSIGLRLQHEMGACG